MDIGERIKMLRTQQGLTLEEVGTRVGVGKSTVRKWESGQIANMRRDKIALLAKALNVTPTYLMGWKEESDPDTVYVADDSLKPLYENIKKYRKQAGLTQEELAKKAGYTDRSSIAKIESGHVDLTQSKIRQFAEIFGVTPSALMGLDAEKEARPALPDAIPYTPMPLVRVAGAVRCGPGGLAIEEDLGYERADVPNAKDYIYLRATGDSMAPQICEGRSGAGASAAGRGERRAGRCGHRRRGGYAQARAQARGHADPSVVQRVGRAAHRRGRGA